ncbi:MAG: hypothetical protein ACOZF2_10890 [Thermodesulfobacteriota bacterium]
MAKGKKAARSGALGLPPLTADAAARLQDLTAQAGAALEAGQDQESLGEMVAATTGDLSWDLHLLAALGSLAHPGVPGLLAALFGAAADKSRKKALKRALHLLKTKGVPVPEDLLPREEAKPRRSPGLGPTLAHLSQVMGNGECFVILEGPKEFLGGNFLVSRISDTAGFRECHLLTVKSRQHREFWDLFREQGLTDFASPPPAQAVRLLEEAQELNPNAEGASRYRSLKPKIFQEWGRPEEAPALAALLPPFNPAEQSRLLDQSRSLALHPLFLTWLPGLEELTPWLEKLRDVQESRIVLNEQQRQARLEDVVEEAVRDLYPLKERHLWRGRLLAMAYFLDLRGQETEARWAQAVAQDLETATRSPLAGESPFFKALVWESLKLAREYLEKSGKEEASSPLLAPPTDPLLIRR